MPALQHARRALPGSGPAAARWCGAAGRTPDPSPGPAGRLCRPAGVGDGTSNLLLSHDADRLAFPKLCSASCGVCLRLQTRANEVWMTAVAQQVHRYRAACLQGVQGGGAPPHLHRQLRLAARLLRNHQSCMCIAVCTLACCTRIEHFCSHHTTACPVSHVHAVPEELWQAIQPKVSRSMYAHVLHQE